MDQKNTETDAQLEVVESNDSSPSVVVYREYEISEGQIILLTEDEFNAIVEYFRLLAIWRDEEQQRA